MTTSDNGIQFLEAREGVRYKAYLDAGGKITIGVGHLVLPTDHFTIMSTINPAQVALLLHQDLRTAESAVNHSITVPIKQGQFDALVSLAFNIGDHHFSTSSLVKAINEGDTADLVKHYWLAWQYAGGRILPQLEHRRILEDNLYNL